MIIHLRVVSNIPNTYMFKFPLRTNNKPQNIPNISKTNIKIYQTNTQKVKISQKNNKWAVFFSILPGTFFVSSNHRTFVKPKVLLGYEAFQGRHPFHQVDWAFHAAKATNFQNRWAVIAQSTRLTWHEPWNGAMKWLWSMGCDLLINVVYFGYNLYWLDSL